MNWTAFFLALSGLLGVFLLISGLVFLGSWIERRHGPEKSLAVVMFLLIVFGALIAGVIIP